MGNTFNVLSTVVYTVRYIVLKCKSYLQWTLKFNRNKNPMWECISLSCSNMSQIFVTRFQIFMQFLPILLSLAVHCFKGLFFSPCILLLCPEIYLGVTGSYQFLHYKYNPRQTWSHETVTLESVGQAGSETEITQSQLPCKESNSITARGCRLD